VEQPNVTFGNIVLDTLVLTPLANGFSVSGSLIFEAASDLVVVSWKARRDFTIGHDEVDVIGIQLDLASISFT
jgi:hypothetical protein